ncbi:TTN [Mytilus coruscus]|uniref:TTN n=1 Tax=Mytilus coruscus TaxID=42192 RepID=A0A6J8D0S4_MYTCO|nr:TTN [Mytilus coruscus]
MDNGNANLNTNDMQNLHIKNQPSLQTTQLRSLTASTSITNGRNAADKITELTDILSSISENGDNVTVKEDDLIQPTPRRANIPADIVNLQDGDRTELEEILIKEGDVRNTGDKSNELVLSDETNEVTANQSIASIGDYEKNDFKGELETGSDYSELPSEPGDLIEIESSSNSISLAWNAPRQGSNYVDHYEIKYKTCNKRGAKWIPVVTETSRRTITVTDLKCGTDYEFRIRAVNEDGDEGPFGTTAKFSTRLSLAKSVQIGATKIKDGNPNIYKLPLYQLKIL